MDDHSTRTLMEQIIEMRVGPLEKGQRETAAVLTRFDRVLIGDPAYKQEGMVDKVQRHDDVIGGWTEEMGQLRGMVKAALGMVKTIMVVGGAIITVIEIAVQLWLHGK